MFRKARIKLTQLGSPVADRTLSSLFSQAATISSIINRHSLASILQSIIRKYNLLEDILNEEADTTMNTTKTEDDFRDDDDDEEEEGATGNGEHASSNPASNNGKRSEEDTDILDSMECNAETRIPSVGPSRT